MRRRRTGVAIGVAVAALVATAGAPAAAQADWQLADKTVTDATGGATARVQLWRRSDNGAVYPRVWVTDSKTDGICAHAAVLWHHDNGNTYPDYGSHVCRPDPTKGPDVKPPRNWRDYRSVSLSAFVDGHDPVPVPLYDFGALESQEPGPTLRLVDRDSDGGGGRGAPDRSCGARVALNVRSTDPARFVSPARPEGVGTVQNCVLWREGEVYGRTYLRLDRTWDLHGQSAKAPLTIRTTLHEGGPDTDGRPGGENFRQRDGKLSADRRYKLTRAFGKVVTGLTDWHDRPDGGTYMFETAAMRPRSFNTYHTQSEVTRPVKYAFIGRIPNEFAGWDATPETFFTDDVFAGTTLAWEGGEMKSPPVPNGKLTRVSDDWLKDHGVNPHEAKKDLPGPPKHFDIYKDSIENLFGVRKGRNPKSNYQYVCNLRNC